MDPLQNDALFAAFDEVPTRVKRVGPPSDADRDLVPPAKKARVSDGEENGPSATTQTTNAEPKPSTDTDADTANVSDNNYYSVLDGVGELQPEPIRPKGPSKERIDTLDIAEKTITEDELLAERRKCSHQVCYPAGWKAPEQVFAAPKRPPAKVYPFTLDPFQKVAVDCLEKGESVLVSAHTSAGKTVVAQYAIAMALRDKQRVVYTSPIKALSNQKYRELYEEFKDVGLMTGDITINQDASCLVMTTEILRSMLYRGSEILREVGWVIFDEIHYMRDKERGVVWEETIILLPDTVRFVFLSATIPNATEFATWIAQIHNQPCHVVYTDFRPTPLQHYIFPAGGEGLFMVVDERGKFREDNFQKSLAALQPAAESTGSASKKKMKNTNDIYRIIKVIIDRHYEPVIVFSFSKKACEALAMTMSKLDLLSDEEKKLVDLIFNNAMDTLSEDDKQLPQVQNILPLLKRGIGIHHSGLLPLLKEVIEILFQEGLLRCLFATETFSIGLNMPAKTVVFTSVRKFDGRNFRWVTSGEYIQMSGRAGRRGLDDRGIVILMVDEKMEPSVAKEMVKGQADTLNSQFYIGYNMLLNLLRMEGIQPEDMLLNSFHQFQNNQAVPKLKDKLLTLESQYRSMVVQDEESLSEYYQIHSQILKLKESIRGVINEPLHILPFLQPGRLVRVRDGDVDWGWGVVINFQKRSGNPKDKDKQTNTSTMYIVDVLLACKPGTAKSVPEPAAPGQPSEPQIVPVLLSLLDGISSLRVYLPKDLRQIDQRQTVLKSLEEVKRRYPDGIPPLDPIEDMQITDSAFKKVVKKIEALEAALVKHPLHNRKNDRQLLENYELYKKKMALHDEIKELRKQIKKADNIILKEELHSMKRVLRRLGYITKENIIDVKGRVAAEINAADELVITELLFSGFFTDLTPQQIASIMSVFVFDEKTDANKPPAKEDLAALLRTVQDTARRVAQVSQECKITIDVEEYVARFKPALMEVVFAWANGAKFGEVIAMTDIFEGSIIRTMRRLEELLRELVSAAKTMGSTDLENKFAVTITHIKRDIVFAASLYL